MILASIPKQRNPDLAHPPYISYPPLSATTTDSQNKGVNKSDLLGLKIAQGGTQAAQRVGLNGIVCRGVVGLISGYVSHLSLTTNSTHPPSPTGEGGGALRACVGHVAAGTDAGLGLTDR